MDKNEAKEIIKVIYKFGELFWEEGEDNLKNAWGKYCSDWVEALAYFVRSYAFARNIRLEKWCRGASKVIKEVGKSNKKPPDNFEIRVWDKFKNEIKNSNPNPSRNPLNPQNGKSLTGFITSREFSKWNYNIINWAKDSLADGKIKEVHKKLTEIRGIGDKIASLFLRDIVDVGGINEKRFGDNRKYLQPIDRWIERWLEEIAPNWGIDPPPKKYWDYAKTIIKIADEVEVEKATYLNAGIWMFGALFSEGEEDFKDAISSKEKLKQHLKKKKDLYRNRINFLIHEIKIDQ